MVSGLVSARSSQSSESSFKARSMAGRVGSSSTQFLSSRCPGTAQWCQFPVAAASLDCPHMSTEPPPAKQVHHERTYHGDTVTDEYAWLAAKDDPDTIAYLKTENASNARAHPPPPPPPAP